MPDNLDLTALLALAEALPEGEWFVRDGGDDRPSKVLTWEVVLGSRQSFHVAEIQSWNKQREIADFIAAARNYLTPTRIRELLAAQAENVRLREERDNFMDLLRRSLMEHGDCDSGKRYGGQPKACTACMAQIKLKELAANWKGRQVRLA